MIDNSRSFGLEAVGGRKDWKKELPENPQDRAAFLVKTGKEARANGDFTTVGEVNDMILLDPELQKIIEEGLNKSKVETPEQKLGAADKQMEDVYKQAAIILGRQVDNAANFGATFAVDFQGKKVNLKLFDLNRGRTSSTGQKVGENIRFQVTDPDTGHVIHDLSVTRAGFGTENSPARWQTSYMQYAYSETEIDGQPTEISNYKSRQNIDGGMGFTAQNIVDGEMPELPVIAELLTQLKDTSVEKRVIPEKPQLTGDEENNPFLQKETPVAA